ncbi:MAG: HAD family hydrolase [Candidatus Thorarchaeota archaeon]
MRYFKAIYFNVGGTLIQPKRGTVPSQYANHLSAILNKRISKPQVYEAFKNAERWVLTRKRPGSLFSDLDQRKYQNAFYSVLGIQGRKQINRIEAELAERLEIEFILEKGVITMLESLTEYKLGIVSNWDPSLRDLLTDFGILDYFDSVTISGEIGSGKPGSAIFKSALDDFPNVKAKETIYLGDDYQMDILPAKQLQINAVLYDKGPTGMHGRPFQRNADCPRVESLEELPSLIQRTETRRLSKKRK